LSVLVKASKFNFGIINEAAMQVKDLAESKGKWILANVQADESESREVVNLMNIINLKRWF
jgi:hypothetical protein